MIKKIAFLVLSLFVIQSAQAAIVSSMTEGEFQEYINKAGFRLLNMSQIEHHFVFRYVPSEKIKTYSCYKDKSIYIPKGILPYVASEDELAAVIAYETAYAMQYYENPKFKIDIKTAPKKYSELADKRAVDMLVKANYSPIAMIAVINKLYGEKKDGLFSKEVKTSVRLARIYEYILKKYPTKLENSTYSRNLYYQNFLLTSRKNREMLQEQLRQDSSNNIKKEYK